MSTAKKPESPTSLLFLFLFGIPFLLAGLGAGGVGVSRLLEYQRAGSWIKTPARFEQVEVKTKRGSKGGTLYFLSARYSYEFQGKTYKSDRISLQESSEKLPDSFRALETRIKEGMQRDRSFPVLVDPQAPDQAIVTREIVTEMVLMPIFGCVFSVVGAGLMLFGLSSYLSGKRRSEAMAVNPERPWRAEGIWKGFTLFSQNSSKLLGMWGIALFMTVFISMFVFALAVDPTAPLFAKGIIGLFALISLGLLCNAIYLTLQYFKYGNSTLLLSQMPLAIGQEFSVVIIIGRHLEMEKGCTVAFKCKRMHTTGSGKQRHTDTTELHSETQIITKDLFRPEKGRSAIPASFKIPIHMPPRDADSNPSFKWFLEVSAETPGVDFATEFELPVYKVSNPDHIEYRDTGM